MYRFDLINYLIDKYNFKSYLEIGVCNPENCFNLINSENKISVDPGVEYQQNPVDYQMTSDEFFSKLDSNQLNLHPDTKWDLIFIDGLHISTQVQKDILNSLNHLSWNGFIVLHDCNPPDIFMAREDYYVDGQQRPWNGTTWKAIYWLRTHRNDLKVCTLDTDWGLGVVTRGKSDLIDFDNPFYEYNKMSQNRIKHLNLIQVRELENWLQNK
jgi:hypothetical protein